MHIRSTQESIANSEPSVLALIETLAAIAVSAGIAIRFDTLAHVAVGACVAPFLLMRSRESVGLGVRLFSLVVPTEPSYGDPILPGWLFFRTLVLSVVIKIIATIRHPIKGIQAIPSNLARVVLCTDIDTPVELVPGVGQVKDTLNNCVYAKEDGSSFGVMCIIIIPCVMIASEIHFLIRPWFSNYIWLCLTWFLEGCLLIFALVFALGLACYIVAYLYRFSLKSTALIWLPLVYVVRTTYDHTLSLPTQLEEMREAALWKLIRFISWFTLALLAAKIVILPNAIDWWNSQTWTKVFNVYVMPNEIHTWHLVD
jgi:hypothetical protein